MRRDYFILTLAEIEKYLSQLNGFDNTKAYELAFAYILVRFHEKQTGQKLKIALPAKESIKEGVSLAEVLRKKIAEDHDVDAFLIPHDLDGFDRKKHKAGAFQFKKFTFEKNEGVEKLLKYLTYEIPRKYQPAGEGILALLIKGDLHISKGDFEKLNSALNAIPDYPFGRVMFIAGKDKDRISFGDLFPSWGHKTYSYDEWFSDDTEDSRIVS